MRCERTEDGSEIARHICTNICNKYIWLFLSVSSIWIWNCELWRDWSSQRPHTMITFTSVIWSLFCVLPFSFSFSFSLLVDRNEISKKFSCAENVWQLQPTRNSKTEEKKTLYKNVRRDFNAIQHIFLCGCSLLTALDFWFIIIDHYHAHSFRWRTHTIILLKKWKHTNTPEPEPEPREQNKIIIEMRPRDISFLGSIIICFSFCFSFSFSSFQFRFQFYSASIYPHWFEIRIYPNVNIHACLANVEPLYWSIQQTKNISRISILFDCGMQSILLINTFFRKFICC